MGALGQTRRHVPWISKDQRRTCSGTRGPRIRSLVLGFATGAQGAHCALHMNPTFHPNFIPSRTRWPCACREPHDPCSSRDTCQSVLLQNTVRSRGRCVRPCRVCLDRPRTVGECRFGHMKTRTEPHSNHSCARTATDARMRCAGEFDPFCQGRLDQRHTRAKPRPLLCRSLQPSGARFRTRGDLHSHQLRGVSTLP